jgi:hypothetical protein
LHRVGDKVPPISKGAEDEQRRQVEPVVRVVQFRAPLKNLSDCDAAPYLRFFLVRNEEVAGSIPVSSTKLLCFATGGVGPHSSEFRKAWDSPDCKQNKCAMDLKNLTTNKNIPETLRSTAVKLQRTRAELKK